MNVMVLWYKLIGSSDSLSRTLLAAKQLFFFNFSLVSKYREKMCLILEIQGIVCIPRYSYAMFFVMILTNYDWSWILMLLVNHIDKLVEQQLNWHIYGNQILFLILCVHTTWSLEMSIRNKTKQNKNATEKIMKWT